LTKTENDQEMGAAGNAPAGKQDRHEPKSNPPPILVRPQGDQDLKSFARGILTLHFAGIFFRGCLRKMATPPSPRRRPVRDESIAAPINMKSTGSARSGKTRCRGDGDSGHHIDGEKKYAARLPRREICSVSIARGRYVIRVELHGLASFTQEVVPNPENPTRKSSRTDPAPASKRRTVETTTKRGQLRRQAGILQSPWAGSQDQFGVIDSFPRWSLRIQQDFLR